MLSEALVDRFVGILLDEADRVARSGGLAVELNALGMLVAWEKASPLHLRQLALIANVEWRVKYLLLNKLSNPKHLELIRERFMERLLARAREANSELQAAS